MATSRTAKRTRLAMWMATFADDCAVCCNGGGMAKSLKKLKERIRAKTSRLEGRSLKEIVGGVNRTLRGWYGYFQHSKANTFGYVDGYVRRRLRSLLQWRRDGQEPEEVEGTDPGQDLTIRGAESEGNRG